MAERLFGKIGTDVYETTGGTQRKLELPEFKSLGLNYDHLPTIQTQSKFSITPFETTAPLVPSSNVSTSSKPSQSSVPVTPTQGGGKITDAIGGIFNTAKNIVSGFGNLADTLGGNLLGVAGLNQTQNQGKQGAQLYSKAPNQSVAPPPFTRAPNQSFPEGAGYYDEFGNKVIVTPRQQPISSPEEKQRRLEEQLKNAQSSFDVDRIFKQFQIDEVNSLAPTGFGGTSGSSYQLFNFPNASGLSGVAGGGSLLPGSLGSPFRTAGAPIILPSEEEEKKKRQQISTKQDFSVGDFARNFFGMPANAAELPGGPSTAAQGSQGFSPQQGPSFLSKVGSGLSNFFNPRIEVNQSRPASAPILNNGNYFSGGGTTDVFASLNRHQQALISNILGSPSKVSSSGTTPPMVTGEEFSSGSTGNVTKTSVKSSDTASEQKRQIAERAAVALSSQNAATSQIKIAAEQQAQQAAISSLTNGQEVYFKSANPETGQIDVFKLTPEGSSSHVTLEEFQQKGLNIDHIKDAQTFGAEFDKALNENRSKLIDPITDNPYTKEDWELSNDNPLKQRLNEIDAQIKAFKEKFNVNIDIESERTKVIEEEGLASLRSQKKALQDSVNGITGVYEKIADEIREDPDFSKNLKSRRLSFLTTEQDRALKGFQRQMDLLNDDIKIAEEKVTQRISDKIKTYEIQFNQLKELDDQRAKIESAMAKASDDDRQLAFQVLSTYGGGTLSPEARASILSLLNNKKFIGVIENGLTLKQKSLELQAQSVANRTPTNVTIINPNTGAPIQGRLVPRGTPGLSDGQADSLNNDMQGANDAINTILQSTTINDAEKQRRINSILIDLGSGYASNKTALALINQRFPSASSLLGNIQNTGKDLAADSFASDLQSELANVNSGWSGKKGRAERSQERLIAKYPQYNSQIKASFSPYIK